MTRSEEKIALIIKTAKKLFLAQGFTITSMDQIAQTAGVSKKTVYHHFPDKVRLFQAVISEHWHHVMQLEQPLFDENKTPAENLQNFSSKLLAFFTQKKTMDLLRLLIAESNKFPHLAKILISNNAGPFTNELAQYLKKENTKGTLKIANAELAADQFLGMLKERHFWLNFFAGIKKKNQKQINHSIKEAIKIFLQYYQKDGGLRG